ncbi:MAG: hypothetical protein HeimC2_22690 [Candidatus Heimdallarchaeota archaeon LC_2]|nr:MAG: hypothetical protein HeimC2_22690 [Candidatus Heimdallarchaeota archaeon LC_2]
MPLYPGLLISTKRNFEASASSEIHFALTEKLGLERSAIHVKNTGISGLITVEIKNNDILDIINQLKALEEDSAFYMHCLKIKPIQLVTKYENDISIFGKVVEEKFLTNETTTSYKVVVEKRHSKLKSIDIIEQIAKVIPNPVNLNNPEWILLIEIIADIIGISRMAPDTIFSTGKAFDQQTKEVENWFLN